MVLLHFNVVVIGYHYHHSLVILCLLNMSHICSTLESTAQFAKTLKQYNECYCFMLNFTHRAAHSGDKVTEVNYHNEKMLDKLEKEYPDVFSEPTYPIWEYRQPF